MTKVAEKTPDIDIGESAPGYPSLIHVAATVAALYFGRDIFMPLATAILLTFALAPGVSGLRRLRIPAPVAVVTVVAGAFAGIVLFGMVVASQLASLAGNLPLYQNNIEAKVRSIKDANLGDHSWISVLFERLGHQMEEEDPAAPGEVAPAEPAAEPPLPVQVVDPTPQPFQVVQTIVGPLLEPLTTGGIVIVVVIFMLLRREDLRDRFIRLVGGSNIHGTTEALEDAGRRVGQYLLLQLVVNVTYAIPIAIGLWLIGIPNPLLWGLVALVMRFVPFIGPLISSIFPLALAFAVDSGWSMLLWTGGLFIVVELVSGNVVEPLLYGSRTGLSPLAIILAAVLWTWLWGPLGLLLSTPLTVCLVVLGKHVPRFEFLDVLFGNKPVLEPHQQLYQRLLAGDPVEATERAEAFLAESDLITFYETVAIPALAVGELDRARGVMSSDRMGQVSDSALTLVDNLEEYTQQDPYAEKPEPLADSAKEEDASAGDPRLSPIPDGAGKSVLCAGGRGKLDDAAAAMLAQVLTAQGATGLSADHLALEPRRIRDLDLINAHSIVIGYLNPEAAPHARYVVRRLKRARQSLRIGIVFWSLAENAVNDSKVADSIGCDFVAHTMREAVVGALAGPVASALTGTVTSKTRPKSDSGMILRTPRNKAATVTA